MTEEVYFFDSYAIMEMVYENEDYKDYIYKSPSLTKLNLFEVFYHILRESGEEDADKVFQKYSPFAVDFGDEIIKESAKFRLEHKGRNMSMTDCIGYIISKKLGIKFLTGDKEFEDLDNVEFVK